MIRCAICIATAAFALVDRADAVFVLPPVAVEGDAIASKTKLQMAENKPPVPEGPETAPPVTKAQHAQQVEPVPVGNPLWAIPLRQLSATRDRPLFSPSRRPPPSPVADMVAAPPPPPPPKAAEPERPQLALVGTIVGAIDRLCVFLDQTSKNMVRLRVGESHQGWTLKSVATREATVQKNEATVVIALPVPGERSPLPVTLGAAPNAQTNAATPASKANADNKIPAPPPQAPGLPTTDASPASLQAKTNMDAFRREAAKVRATQPQGGLRMSDPGARDR